jgi:hypothetical protein
LIERAERSRAPIEKIADRLAGYLVYFALGCAALTFWITRDARSTISVIVVAGANTSPAKALYAKWTARGRSSEPALSLPGSRFPCPASKRLPMPILKF